MILCKERLLTSQYIFFQMYTVVTGDAVWFPEAGLTLDFKSLETALAQTNTNIASLFKNTVSDPWYADRLYKFTSRKKVADYELLSCYQPRNQEGQTEASTGLEVGGVYALNFTVFGNSIF